MPTSWRFGFATLTLPVGLALAALPAFAQDAAAPAAPAINGADTAWMMVCTALVSMPPLAKQVSMPAASQRSNTATSWPCRLRK